MWAWVFSFTEQTIVKNHYKLDDFHTYMIEELIHICNFLEYYAVCASIIHILHYLLLAEGMVKILRNIIKRVILKVSLILTHLSPFSKLQYSSSS